MSNSSAERLQKIIAQAGIASRRDAEDLIREGAVTVNGKTAKLGDKAILGTDAIKVKGKLILHTDAKVYYLFYKPKNVIAMLNEDEEGRVTIKDIIQKRIKERVFPVGRMDYTGEGAIILTNDGAMTQEILKSNTIIRRYHIKIDRHPTQEDMAKLARGGRIEGRSMNPFHVRLVKSYSKNSLIEISFEGMGALDLKKFLENKGFHAEKIARMGIGHLSVEGLMPGTFKKLEASSVQALLKQPELAKKKIENLVQAKSSDYKVIDLTGGGSKRGSSRNERRPRISDAPAAPSTRAAAARGAARDFASKDTAETSTRHTNFVTKNARAPLNKSVRGAGSFPGGAPKKPRSRR